MIRACRFYIIKTVAANGKFIYNIILTEHRYNLIIIL